MLLIHHTFHIFNDYNCIVDHDSDSEYESQEGEHVERESEYEHDAECSDERYGDSHKRNNRGSPTLQGKENDDKDKEKRLEKGFVDFVDRLGDVGGHVEGHVVGDAFGERAAYFLHLFFDIFRHFHCVGSGKHIDREDGGIGSVDSALGVVGLGFERYARHVAQSYYRAVGISSYHNVFKLRD